MGDVGSLAIGSALGVIAIIIKQEFVFFVISILFFAFVFCLTSDQTDNTKKRRLVPLKFALTCSFVVSPFSFFMTGFMQLSFNFMFGVTKFLGLKIFVVEKFQSQLRQYNPNCVSICLFVLVKQVK